ncbi:MAG: leucine-rich repeat protein, partial [Muribaculaceae bacterium]|nr:leucine-rich repeat protein [Muribaculaceae bacterium]
IGDLAFGFSFDFDGTLTIGTGVTSIGESAFKYCDGFTGNLTIPNSVTEIGGTAFSDCSGFTGNLTIGTGVTSIGKDAFKNCSGFTQVNYNAINCADVIPDDDGNYTSPFKDCSGTLTIGNTVQRIPAHMFKGCSGFTGSLSIPNSVTSIGRSAFYSCDGFTGLTLGNSVTTLDYAAFAYCSGITGSLSIPSSVTTIGDFAFYRCVGFNGSLTIGSSVTTIGYAAFYNCGGFTGSLSIPNSVTSIGDYAFTNCDGFTGGLTLGNSVTTIGYAAFAYCTGFKGTLTIPNSVTTIGVGAFCDCEGFTGSLNIGNSVTTIGEYAFEECYGFTGRLTIGNSVTSIGDEAFYDCTGLTAMTVNPETPPTLGAEVFTNVPTDIPVTVPCSALSDYQSAEGWSDFTDYQCNYLVTITTVPITAGWASGEGTYTRGTTVTVNAYPNDDYAFMHWTMNGTVESCNPSYSFDVNNDTELEAVFVAQENLGDIIGDGSTSSNASLPSHSLYNYSLTEQIYTADELNGITTITSISFFNVGPTKTRTYDIYMKYTNKTNFDSGTDWVSVASSNKVYSGSVTLRAGMWTTVVLDTPFSCGGSSNLLLVVDDNSGNWSSSMQCLTYATDGDQAIRIYSDGTNYNPLSPSSYTGTPLSEKNQIMLNRTAYNISAFSSNTNAGMVSGGGTYGQGDLCTLSATVKSGYTFVSWVDESGVVVSTDVNYSFIVTENKTLMAHFMSGTDVCSLTFDLHDSYGDGWNNNYLVVDCANGMSETLAVPSDAHDATFTLPVEDGSHVELSWIEGNWVDECSFAVRDANDLPVFVATNLNDDYEYEFDMNCSGMSSELTYVGDSSTANNVYLPSYSYYYYSLTEQIYTADEIGEAGFINCIAFYNQGAEKTRNLAIYMATTDKWEFDSRTDWISTSDATLVYSGNVTMHAGKWTPITFNTLFEYDGVSNLVLIVDDNSGDYTTLNMACRVYDADGLQALRIFSDNTNYNPYAPSNYTGTLASVKNQIMFNLESCEEPMDLTVTDITTSSASIGWTSANDNFELRYREAGPTNVYGFEGGLGNWTTIDADGDGYDWFYMNSTSLLGHNGTIGLVESESWYSLTSTILTPDNYLVSPQVTLGGSITFWACAQDAAYPAEHFGVAVSTTGNTSASDFTTIQEWTMTAKGEGGMTNMTRSGNRAQGTWYQYTVDLSAYAGQRGYVAIRHFNCTDMFRLNVDDITIMQPSTDSWTVVDNPSNPYAITSLMSKTEYEVQVRADCIGGNYTDWASTTFTTLNCEARSLPYTCGFENENDFSCWAMVNCHNNTGISTDAGHASPHGFSFYYTYTPPQYLISPELTG